MNTCTMTLSLHAPGMTPVHRVGIAGLYMTLQRITVEHLDVELSDTKITLSWEKHHTKQVLLDLFKQGLALDDNGIIAFPGLLDGHGDMPSAHQRILFQEALCTSLLQHGKSRTWAETEPISLGNEEGTHYLPLKDFAHQKGAEVLWSRLSKPRTAGWFKVASWLYPGAAEKHPGKAWSRMEASFEEALGLYFLPVGLAAWSVQSQLTHTWKHGRDSVIRPYQGEMAVLVLPSITSLSQYAEWKRAMTRKPIEESKVSCLEDALCRVAASLAEDVQHLPIQVMAYGVQDWSTQQKTRQYVRSFELQASKIAFIRTCLERIPELHPVYSNHYWRTSPVWEGVCRALVAERPWFEGVTLAYENSDKSLFTSTQYVDVPFHRLMQRHALAKMIEI